MGNVQHRARAAGVIGPGCEAAGEKNRLVQREPCEYVAQQSCRVGSSGTCIYVHVVCDYVYVHVDVYENVYVDN